MLYWTVVIKSLLQKLCVYFEEITERTQTESYSNAYKGNFKALKGTLSFIRAYLLKSARHE